MLRNSQALRAESVALVAIASLVTMQSTPAQESNRSGKTLEEVVVTAQKREENLQDVPLSVNVLNAEQLDRAQVNSVVELSNIAPSFNFQSGVIGATVSYSMRGIGAFAPQPAIQPPIGVVVDGVPFSRQVEFDADLSDVENVQLISGAQGTLYGTNTIGGVINIATREPTESFEGYIEASATDDEEFMGRLALSGPLSQRVRGRALLYAKDRRGYIKNLYPGAERPGGEETYGINLKLDVDVSENVGLRLRADYRDSYAIVASDDTIVEGIPALTVSGNGNPELGRRVVFDPALSYDDLTHFNDLVNWGVSADLSWRVGDALSLKSISSYRDLELGTHLGIDNTPASPANPMGVAQVSALRTNQALNAELGLDPEHLVFNTLEYFTQELRLESVGDPIDWVIGAFYHSNDELVGNEVPVVLANGSMRNTPRRADVALRSWSAFTDLTWHVTDAVDVFGGLRWTEEKMTNDFLIRIYNVPAGQFTAGSGGVITVAPGVLPASVRAFDEQRTSSDWSGRAGARWSITPDVNVYVSAARGYTGLGADTSTTATRDAAFVDPTIADSYELGAKTTLLDNRLRLNLALFRTEVQDLQAVTFGGGLTGVELRTINVGTLDTQGLEVTMTALLGERLTVSGALALLDTEIGGGVLQRCFPLQTAAQGCGDFNRDGVPDQKVDGKPGLNAPEVKYNVSATYEPPLADSIPFTPFATVSYTWKDRTEYDLIYDPIASYQDSFGLLDVTLGVIDRRDRFEVSLFGKNVLDEHFVGLQRTGLVNARASGVYPRGAFAYWGVKAKYNF